MPWGCRTLWGDGGCEAGNGLPVGIKAKRQQSQSRIVVQKVGSGSESQDHSMAKG